MKNKGVLVINGFLDSAGFKELYGLFLDASKKYSINLELKRNCDLLFDASSFKPLFSERPDFILFWDKDIRLAKQLEAAGFTLYNSAQSIELCDDKSLTHIELSKHGIPMPKTIISPMTFANIGYTHTDFADKICDELGLPIVVKECYGSFGQQVSLVQTKTELERLIKGKTVPMIFQEFIKTSFARDVRIYVVGGRVIASMLRKNTDGDFRANVGNGGKVFPYEPSLKEKELAVCVCEKLGLTFGGVDILFGENDAPLLCEVNSNAHFKGILDCTGVNAADEIIKFISEKTV
ncbi:MAG: RimK family alpha-L-glutamate ligase [Clostridia bacterium]|nr:RimK family alpha-L-glutamate ligase [Clostridia bacterium]